MTIETDEIIIEETVDSLGGMWLSIWGDFGSIDGLLSGGGGGGGDSSSDGTPTASDADGDGEIDEISTTATIIRQTSFAYWFDPIDFSSLEIDDYGWISFQYDQMLETFCGIVQDAIDNLENNLGISFEISDVASDNSRVDAALAAFAISVFLYGDISVSSSNITSAGFVLEREAGNVIERSFSLYDLASASPGNYYVTFSDGPTAEMLFYNQAVDQGYIDAGRTDIDRVLLLPENFLSSNFSGITDAILSTVVHEFGHAFNQFGNFAPWDIVYGEINEPGYHHPDTSVFIGEREHQALGDYAALLTDAVMQAAYEDYNDLLLNYIGFLEECGFDLG